MRQSAVYRPASRYKDWRRNLRPSKLWRRTDRERYAQAGHRWDKTVGAAKAAQLVPRSLLPIVSSLAHGGAMA